MFGWTLSKTVYCYRRIMPDGWKKSSEIMKALVGGGSYANCIGQTNVLIFDSEVKIRRDMSSRIKPYGVKPNKCTLSLDEFGKVLKNLQEKILLKADKLEAQLEAEAPPIEMVPSSYEEDEDDRCDRGTLPIKRQLKRLEGSKEEELDKEVAPPQKKNKMVRGNVYSDTKFVKLYE